MRQKSLPFDKFYGLLLEYVAEFGNCKIPMNYVTPSGVRLGVIVHSIRTGTRKVSVEERKKLDDIGFVWSVFNIYSFDEIIKMLTKYVEEYGHCNVPATYKTSEGIKLGSIVQGIRNRERKMSDIQKERLNNLGFVWHVKTPFSTFLDLLVEYKKIHGNCNVPIRYEVNGIKLGYIVHNIRNGNRKINAEERLLLDMIGFRW